MAMLVTSTLAIVAALPFLTSYLVRWSLRVLGSHLRKQTTSAREIVLQRARAEEVALSSDVHSAEQDDDQEGWERVDSVSNSDPIGSQDTRGDAFAGLIGFFHPFCNAGGGGERVLWAAIRATQRKWPRAVCVVYCGDHQVDKAAMIERVFQLFGITLHPPTLAFFYLSTRHLVHAGRYPRFTLLGQSLGSLVLAYDAFGLMVPDLMIDTMGYAFSLTLAKYLFPDMPVGAYVHYPIISTDMLDTLDESSGGHGIHTGAGAGFRGSAKRQYWHWLARLYGWAGSHIDVVMCNSSWTQGHIASLWESKTAPSSPPTIVYPPCPVEEIGDRVEVSRQSEGRRDRQIVYIAQFRPEKNHSLILQSFAAFVNRLSPDSARPRLVLIGSVRSNTADELHIYKLRLQAHELSVHHDTHFVTDAPYTTVLQHLQSASVGTNGMWNEHFGIGVVEYLASGVIPVVHDSGGPKLDIVLPMQGKPTGFHAETVEQYADAFRAVFELSPEERFAMRVRAKEQAQNFSEAAFSRRWTEEAGKLVQMASS